VDMAALTRIQKIVSSFWDSDLNTLGWASAEKAWETPVLACASGADPLFADLKADIGEFYWTPAEAFALGFPGAPVAAEQLSVVSWILPQTQATRDSQRRQKQVPAERWARSRFYGEAFNYQLREYLAASLCADGLPAVAPECLKDYSPRCHSPRYGLASNWSERHVAWVAGHGTFGLSDGLITPFGKAVRFGSIVVAAQLPVSKRPYRGRNDWCLHYTDGSCDACSRRCPAGAISRDGHDKERCLAYIETVTTPYVHTHYGTGSTPCGLCQTGIPCEAGVPAALRRSEEVPD